MLGRFIWILVLFFCVALFVLSDGFRHQTRPTAKYTAYDLGRAFRRTLATRSLADLGNLDKSPATAADMIKYGQLSPSDRALASYCLAAMNSDFDAAPDGSDPPDDDYTNAVSAMSIAQIADRYHLTLGDAAALLNHSIAKVDKTAGGINPRYNAPSACVAKGFWFINPKVLGEPSYDAGDAPSSP